MSTDYQSETLAVRAGVHRTEFNEHSEALFLTSSFVFDSAAQAAARFAETEAGNIYSRFTNPTVTAFQERLAALEGAQACYATSSGMSAILAVTMALLKAGDHIVTSHSIFGATVQLFNNFLARFGVETTFVPQGEVAAWRAAVRPNTRLLFVETPSNPLTEVCDLRALADIAHDAGAKLVVDNSFCTPILQRPLEFGADLVVYSATKCLDGQGRVLGGAIVGAEELLKKNVLPFMRNAGPSMSPFNAWVCLKGLETLKLRMQAQSQAGLEMARWLEQHPAVARVLHPQLPSHPQHALAMQQQKYGGSVVSFEVRGGREQAWSVIDATKLISITANLGDVKSTITHPASTTHGRISPEARQAAGIGEGLLRIAVGLEDLADLQRDLARGLDALVAARSLSRAA